MIIFPTPTLARGPVYRGPVNYIAMAQDFVSADDPVVTNLHFRVSANGRKWFKKTLKGDILDHLRSDAAGAFYPRKMIVAFSTVFVIGQLWDDPNNSRAAVFKLSGGEFNRIATPIDGTKGASGVRYFSDAAVEASGNLVLLCNSGERTVSTDGATFSGSANIGFAGVASAIAAGTGVVVAGGSGGQGFSAANASASFTARNLQFGTTAVSDIRAGNVLVAVGDGKISTSALNSGTTWTAQADPVGGAFDWLGYGNGRWFAAGVGKWISSALGATWAVPSQSPLSGSRVRAGFWDGEKWILLLSGGVAAISEDNENWLRLTENGLATANYYAVAKLP